MYLTLFISFFASFLLAYFLSPVMIRFANKWNLVTDSKKSIHPAHTHEGIIPRAGGAAIFLSIAITWLFFVPMSNIVISILIASTILVITGLLDDKYGLTPGIRLAVNLVCAAIVVSQGMGIPYFSLPGGQVVDLSSSLFRLQFLGFSLLWLADIIAILYLSAMMNFINWSKGVDGQLPGFVGVSCIFLSLLALRFSSHDISSTSVALMAIISSGAFLGFLPWNFFPQRIMPGYSGGVLAGFILGVLSLLSWGKMGTILMCLAVPLTDAFYAMARRILAKKSPFLGDNEHLHHRLLSIGWGKRRITVFYMGLSFIYGMVALYLPATQKMIALILTTVLLGGFFYIIDHIKSNQAG